MPVLSSELTFDEHHDQSANVLAHHSCGRCPATDTTLATCMRVYHAHAMRAWVGRTFAPTTLTISSVPNHVAVHVDNRDLQKANGKLGVTAWRCETLCDSPAGVDVRAGRKRGTFCSHSAGLRMRQQLR